MDEKIVSEAVEWLLAIQPDKKLFVRKIKPNSHLSFVHEVFSYSFLGD